MVARGTGSAQWKRDRTFVFAFKAGLDQIAAYLWKLTVTTMSITITVIYSNYILFF